jgi:hypothetical protein
MWFEVGDALNNDISELMGMLVPLNLHKKLLVALQPYLICSMHMHAMLCLVEITCVYFRDVRCTCRLTSYL